MPGGFTGIASSTTLQTEGMLRVSSRLYGKSNWIVQCVYPVSSQPSDFTRLLGLDRLSAGLAIRRLMVEGTDCLGVAAAPAYRKPWIAFARQEFTRSGFDECSNHLN